VLVTFFLSQILAGLLLSIYPALQHWTNAQANDWISNSINAQFFYVLLAEGLALGLLYLFLRGYRTSFAVVGLRKPRWLDVGKGALAFPVYFVAYLFITGIAAGLIHGLNVDQAQDIGFNNVHTLLPLVLTFISLVILPPLTEEIMVRGFLFGSLRKNLSFIWATLITSLIFASAHLPEGGSAGPLWIGAIDTFILSVVLCYLREKTNSLWAGITLHALKNGVAFVALFLIGSH